VQRSPTSQVHIQAYMRDCTMLEAILEGTKFLNSKRYTLRVVRLASNCEGSEFGIVG